MKNFFLNRKELKERKNSENVPINPDEEIWNITWIPTGTPLFTLPSNITLTPPNIVFPPPIIFIP